MKYVGYDNMTEKRFSDTYESLEAFKKDYPSAEITAIEKSGTEVKIFC